MVVIKYNQKIIKYKIPGLNKLMYIISVPQEAPRRSRMRDFLGKSRMREWMV